MYHSGDVTTAFTWASVSLGAKTPISGRWKSAFRRPSLPSGFISNTSVSYENEIAERKEVLMESFAET